MLSARIRKGILGAAWLRVVLLAAVVATAFAHRPLLDQSQALELAQYVLPDGSHPVICSTDETGGAPASHDHIICDFCLIAGSSQPAMPVAVVLSRPLPLVLAVLVPEVAAPPAVPVELSTAPKRGPPVLFS